MAGVATAAAWLIGASDHVDRFARTGVPGAVSAPIDTQTPVSSTTKASET